MSRVFLQAEWRNLLMANYSVDPKVLSEYIPRHTELDDFNGVYYVSLVGFLFKNTKVMGLSIPFHRTFEEVNLRFYVRYKEGNSWKRGVVFIKELVPRQMITLVANKIYGENYATHRMKHLWENKGENIHISYQWKIGTEWNYLKAIAESEAKYIINGSEEEFITEHYWGYTFINKASTGVYKVAHPQWKIHAVESYDIHCSMEKLYGRPFKEALSQQPRSVFLAEGSPIQVMKGLRI